MEFILGVIVFFIFLVSRSERKSSSDNNFYMRHNGFFAAKRDDGDSIDPADTFHYEDGLDHDVDCDGYCEECDDYHDV